MRQASRKGARCVGFTLVELLVVMAIIAILAGLLTPALVAAMRKAHEASTQNTIHLCEMAAQSFFAERGDYPPSNWAEINRLFKVDLDGDNVYDPDLTSGDNAPFQGLTNATDPSTINEGIEVFTACLASRTGGPYLEPTAKMLRNVDGQDASGNPDSPDTDTTLPYANAVAACTNSYFTPAPIGIFEIVDWWGNPLVYFHNRDYAAHDGWNEAAVPPAFDPAAGEGVVYADVDGNTGPCYARSANTTPALPSGTYPNLNGFQLYSWGYYGLPGCAESTVTPGTPNPNKEGIWPGWTKQSGNKLLNWEE